MIEIRPFQRSHYSHSRSGKRLQLEALETRTLLAADINLSLGTAAQSSQLDDNAADRALDDLRNFTHTLADDENPTWQVLLPETYTFDTVEVFNRSASTGNFDCCPSRLRDITIQIVNFQGDVHSDFTGGVVAYSSELLNPENQIGDGTATKGPLSLSVEPGGAAGNLIRVIRTPDDDLSGTGGAGTNDERSVLSIDLVLASGDLTNDINLAAGTAVQSSELAGFGAEQALDDVVNHTHTLAGDENPTWQVLLPETHSFDALTVFNRSASDGTLDCCPSRLRDITIQVVSFHGDVNNDFTGGVVTYSSELLNPENVMGGGTDSNGPVGLTVNPDGAMGNLIRVIRTPDDDLSGTGGAGNSDERSVLSLDLVTAQGVDPVPLQSDNILVGDLDENGKVEFADFLQLSAAFGQTVAPFSNGDVDGNGAVEFQDFLALSANFGKTVDQVFGRVGSGPGFGRPFYVAVEADGNLVVLDFQFGQPLFRVNPVTGDRTIVSSGVSGSGPRFRQPSGMAVESGGSLVVVDSFLDAVFRVDPVTGDRTILSDGTDQPFSSPSGIAVEPDGSIVVVDRSRDAVFRVNPITGGRTTLSHADTGNGPAFSKPEGIAVAPDGSLFVVDSFLDAVFRVDPVTGDRSIVSDANTGTGPIFSFPEFITVQADGSLAVVDVALNAVFRVDPVTGDRKILSDLENGSGADFRPHGIAVASDGDLVVTNRFLNALERVDPVNGNRAILSATDVQGFKILEGVAAEDDGSLLVIDSRLNAVIRVDPDSNESTIVSDPITGTGPNLDSPTAIAVEADGSLVVVGRRAVLRVDPVTGDRTIVSDPITGAGPNLGSPTGIAVKADGSLVVVDQVQRAVFRVDPVTGDRTIVSDFFNGIGIGPTILSSTGIAVEADGSLVVVGVTDDADAVVRVDPVTGDRTIVSDVFTGTGLGFFELSGSGIAVEADGSLVVVDSFLDAVFRVDPVTGDRTILSDVFTGTGPFMSPTGIAVEADGSLVVVDQDQGAVFRVDPVTGDRTLVTDGSDLDFALRSPG